jgi:hypothetical protein
MDTTSEHDTQNADPFVVFVTFVVHSGSRTQCDLHPEEAGDFDDERPVLQLGESVG